MTWVLWRQHRYQLLTLTALLVTFAAFMLFTGSHMYHATRGLRAAGSYESMYWQPYLVPILLVLPAFIGAFWGVPLIAREIEQRTLSFAWTQGVSRRRWTLAKVGSVIGTMLVAGLCYAAIVAWWTEPLVATLNYRRMLPGFFDLGGIVSVGYIVFAVALGIALGQLIVKTVPAMAATIGVFAAVRIGFELARPHFLPAKTFVAPEFGFYGTLPEGGWILGGKTVDAHGRILKGFDLARALDRCMKAGPDACLGKLRNIVWYQPAGRFFAFQMIEFAIFMGLAAALVAFVFRRIKRTS